MDKLKREITLPVSKQRVVIQEGDGYVERQLLKRNKKLQEALFDYLAAVTVSLNDDQKVGPEQIMNLLTPDQEYLAIEAYKLSFDDEFEFEFTCPACGAVAEQSFDLNDLDFIDPPEGADPTIEVTLPRSGRKVVVGMLTGHNEKTLNDLIEKTGTIDLVQASFQAIRSLDGNDQIRFEDVVAFPLKDQRAIRRARAKLVCGYDTNIRVSCPSCGERSSINILMHRDFFVPGA